MGRVSALAAFLFALCPAAAWAATIAVPAGQPTIQAALDAAGPGDTVEVADGVYSEKVVFTNGGSLGGGSLVLRAAAGASPILDGTGVTGANMVLIDTRSYVEVAGFEIRNNLGVNDGSGIRIIGNGTNIEIRDNVIHDMRGLHAMGITVYGTDAQPIENLIIDGNEIYDSEPATSEALTLNGNVTDFQVTNNTVRDVNNIGIDFIGGETDIQPDQNLVARNGLCAGNTVINANSNYGGGFAGGIYVDGGRDIVVERNTVTGSDLGIEIGAENAGLLTSGIIVRDNFVYDNDKVGIVFGGFKSSVGRANDNFFLHNTLYKNDTLSAGFGEFWIQYAENNTIGNNIVYSGTQNLVLYSEAGNVGALLDYNLWYTEAGSGAARFVVNGTEYAGFAAYQAATGQDASGQFADPSLVDADNGDLHIAAASPAVDAGDPAFVAGLGETDIDGAPRVVNARVDIGADELSCGDGNLDAGEECDDSNLIDGDGCDSNCTVTACGNGVATPSTGEQCDDGGAAAGDCCDAVCQFEASGSACVDADACSINDQCDGAGTCVGSTLPEPACLVVTAPGKAQIRLRDRAGTDKDQLKWKWTKGEETLLADFGDATVSTSYSLCVYDESAAGSVTNLMLSVTVFAGGQCGRNACWQSSGTKGFRYKDKAASAGGVQAIKLSAGADGKARIGVKARGGGLVLPSLPPAQDPAVVVQLKNTNGVCWTSRFAAPALRDDAEQFKDKGE